jgi:N-acetylmuramoyl-L-alanine amidase
MSAVILKRGDIGPAVSEVRDRLIHLGLLTAKPGGSGDIFDDELFEAISVFQQSRGLTVDGIVGPRTIRRLDEARWKIGDRVLSFTPGHIVHGEDVAQLQQRLVQLGFVLNRVDGVFGKDTDRCVREFQNNVGLPVDGICGPDVFRALTRLSRTITGGSQEHLRELSSWDNFGRNRTLETATIVIEPSTNQTKLLNQELSISEVCWDIANRLEGRLSAHGTLVLLTRSKSAVQQSERNNATFANEQNADLVISISVDNYPNDRACGVASYYFGHEFSRSSPGLQLAQLIQDEVCANSALVNNQIHPKTWDLLRLTRMPSVRVELGYASNPGDAALLADSMNRDRLASSFESAISRLFTPRIG